MIWLVLFTWLIFPVSAISSDTGLVCAIDMGSNNFKLILGEIKAGKYFQHQLLKNKLSVGDDMSKANVITPSKLKEIRQILEKYLAICDSKRILTRSAVATAAFRQAKNQRDVVEIARALNLPLEIASEERESQLAYLVGSLGKPNLAVIDSGSRSIELVTYGSRGYEWHAFDLGYAIAFQQFFQPARTFAEANDTYRENLAPLLRSASFMKNRNGYVGIGMAPVVRYVRSLDRVDGVVVTLDTVSKKISALRGMRDIEFRNLKNVENIDEILPRLVLLEQSLITFAYREMQVFERELGVGLIVQKGIQ
jgi:exopolyphosphatase/pppGpp-phosphohydrolase